jgi:hypothetical protein
MVIVILIVVIVVFSPQWRITRQNKLGRIIVVVAVVAFAPLIFFA